jgi:hypothetical protein
MDKRVIVIVNCVIGAPQVWFKHLCYRQFQSQQFQLEGAVVLVISLSWYQASAAVRDEPFQSILNFRQHNRQPPGSLHLHRAGKEQKSQHMP